MFRRVDGTRTLALFTATAFVSLGTAVLSPTVSLAAGALPVTATAPPSDPAAVGPLTLCGKDGTQVTTGTLAGTATSLWRVIDSTPAPDGYTKDGTATLFAFQPRPGVSSGEWSGQQLTGSGRYSDVSHPMVASTKADTPLSSFLEVYPLLTSAHVLQLRVYLGAPDAPPLTTTYDASFLSVSGSTWTQLDPGPDICSSSGTSVSDESLLLPPSELTPAPQPSQSAPSNQSGTTAPGQSTPGAGQATSTPSGNAAGSGSPVPGAASPTSTAVALATASSGTSDTSRNVIIGACVLLLAAVGGLYAVRRRS